MTTETDQQIRLRGAQEALAVYRDRENTARKALAEAVESTRRAKARYEELFLAEEEAEQVRRKAAYHHGTH